MTVEQLRIAMFSIHSSPIGELGTRNTGGMSVYIRELAQELGTRGHAVDIFTARNGYKSDLIVDLGTNVRLVHLSGGASAYPSKLDLYYALADFSRALERFKASEGVIYDLIHSHYWLSARLGSLMQERWDAPHLVMFHTLGAAKNACGVGKPEPDLRIATERKLTQTCHRILAPTARERDNLIRHYQAPAEKIGVVPCGVNVNLFRPMDKSAARCRLGLSADESIVLYVGRFDPIKGLERLVKAVTYLHEVPRLRLLIVGGDDPQIAQGQKLQRLATGSNIQDVVTFAGRIAQQHLRPYYSAADVLVVPSYYESFGLVGLEALACGTPVIATRVGAMEGILREGQNGQVVDDGSPQILADAIRRFIAVADAKCLPAAAVRSSVSTYSWSHVAAAVLNEYVMTIDDYYGAEMQDTPASLAS